MTKRNPARAIRSGARVLDGRGTGTALNSTGLPPLCDPRDWIWIQWDGSRGLKPARLADIRLTADQSTRPGTPFGPLPPGCRPVSPSDSPPATETAPSPGAADTTERLAKVRACIAGAADDLYDIDRDTLDVQSRIALTAAANDIREAEHALARLLGERPTREYRNEYGQVTTDPTVAEGWSESALETDYRDPSETDWRPYNYEGPEAVTANRIAAYESRVADLDRERSSA